MDINEILFHLGEDRNKYFDAVSPAIVQTSNFAFKSVADLRTKIVDEVNNHVYGRGNNPTTEILRRKIAALEEAEDALIVGSGCAAIACAVMANVKAGDHVLCIDKPYSWTKKLFDSYLPRFGVTTEYFLWQDEATFLAKIKDNTTVVYLESPNSLTFELQDLEAISKICKPRNITTIIDNSHCSPIFQKPITLGIDITVHSATKYLNGHSDVIMGAIAGTKEMIKKIFYGEYMTLGPVSSPHDAFLAIRGIRTLEVRLQKSESSCKVIFDYFKNHPKIRKVYYTFDPEGEQYALAKKQMKGNGGLISVELKATSKDSVIAFTDRINHFIMAASWGGYESLFLPTIAFYDIPGWKDPILPYQLVRFYIGLEDPQYLIKDLEQALEAVE